MKIWLVFMAGPNSLQNLKELIDPVKDYFDGITAVLHDSRNSEEEKYLDSVKKDGEIIHLKYTKRHDFSRQHYLYCGPIGNGDWCVQIDDKERLGLLFTKNLRTFIQDLKSHRLNGAWYYGKPFLFEYHESLKYVGNPHEGLIREDGNLRAIELSHQFPKESDIRYNIRASQRDKHHFVGHYFKYYLFPWGSNQNLLGAEIRGNAMEIFRKREVLRSEFRLELERRNVEWNTTSLLNYWKDNELDDIMRKFINGEKILNDAYRYFILGDSTVVDEHQWVSMKMI